MTIRPDDAQFIDMFGDGTGRKQQHCLFVLDTSGSMGPSGDIAILNDSLQAFVDTLRSDSEAKHAVYVQILTFGDKPKLVLDKWQSIFDLQNPLAPFSASGGTPFVPAMEMATTELETLKNGLKMQRIDYYRPWLILVTDAGFNELNTDPTGFNDLVNRLKQLTEEPEGRTRESRKLTIYSLVTNLGALDVVKRFTTPDRCRVVDKNMAGFMGWLAEALKNQSKSGENEPEELPLPTAEEIQKNFGPTSLA